MGLGCTLMEHVCTLMEHVCTLMEHVCTLMEPVCTLMEPVSTGPPLSILEFGIAESDLPNPPDMRGVPPLRLSSVRMV